MAFTANTAFEARLTNRVYDVLANVAGKYQASGSDADCDAGQLVKRSALIKVEGIPSSMNVYNENTWIMVDAVSTDAAGEVIYACDTYDNQLLSDGTGNNYYIGRRTLGLGAPAGRYCNYTRIAFDNQSIYRFGAGNVTINTAGDTYFTIANGKLSSVTAKPSTSGTLYFTLRGTGYFTEGTSQSFAYYDVVACVAP